MRIRTFLLTIVAGLALSACIFSGNDKGNPKKIQPGVYHADYGSFSPLLLGGIYDTAEEYELVLDSDKTFHLFAVYRNFPEVFTQGTWESRDSTLIWKSVTGSAEDDGFRFKFFDTASLGDTSKVRKISADFFERLESGVDVQGAESKRWIPYFKDISNKPLKNGRYECLQNANGHTNTYFFELTPDGSYREGVLHNNLPFYENDGVNWRQSGSFLVSEQTRELNWVNETWDTLHYLKSAIRIQNVAPDSFQRWLPYWYSSDSAYWLTYRRIN